MDKDIVIGCLLVAGALGLVTYLVLWSRRAIDRIAANDRRSTREIVKELRREG